MACLQCGRASPAREVEKWSWGSEFDRRNAAPFDPSSLSRPAGSRTFAAASAATNARFEAYSLAAITFGLVPSPSGRDRNLRRPPALARRLLANRPGHESAGTSSAQFRQGLLRLLFWSKDCRNCAELVPALLSGRCFARVPAFRNCRRS